MSYTADLSDAFFAQLRMVASALECDPLDLLRVMANESGVHATAHNPNGNAVGLIQFMGPTLRGLGWKADWRAFLELDAAAQLPFVQAYFRPFTGRLVTATACYVATFLPAEIGHASEPGHVLASPTYRAQAYAANRGFDRAGRGSILVSDLTAAIDRACAALGPRWTEITQRLTGNAGPLPTIADVQRALTACGYAPGDADGIAGPRTIAAIRLFQTDHGLDVDGIAGPATRAALAEAVPDDAA